MSIRSTIRIYRLFCKSIKFNTMETKKNLKEKSFFIFLLLVLFTIGNLSSQNLNLTNEQGLKQGKWSKTYSNGSLRYVGTFENGKPVGEFKYYYPSGSIKAITKYSKHGKDAFTKTFHLTGKLLATGKFVNKKKDSTWRYFSNINGKLVLLEKYKLGVLNGKSITYFADKETPAQTTVYVEGQKNGPCIKYFTDGKPSIIENYINDTLNGPFKVYFPEGGLEIEGFYKNDYQDSIWTTYNQKGKVVRKETFSNGILLKTK